MKLIALKDFYRVPALEDVEIDGQQHAKLIHQGATFEIGKAPKLADLGKNDQLLVAQLITAGCVGDATNEKVVAEVAKAVAERKKAEEAQQKREAAASTAALGEQVLASLKAGKGK